MKKFDISYVLFDKYFTTRVEAEDLDAAWEKVANTPILELLKDKTLADFGGPYYGTLAKGIENV